MTFTWASTSAPWLAACLVLAGAFSMNNAQAENTGQTARVPAATVHFALPAEPLAQALQAFNRQSDLVVVADAALLGTRTSEPLTGDYAPQDALARLLAGTGLRAQVTGANSAIILAAPAGAQTAAPVLAPQGLIFVSMIDGLGSAASYATLIQARLTEALCQSPETQPGSYRLAVQLRIGADGSVSASTLLDTTGDAARDAAIARVLGSLVLDAGPPANLPQPVTILLRPQTDGVASGCSQPSLQG